MSRASSAIEWRTQSLLIARSSAGSKRRARSERMDGDDPGPGPSGIAGPGHRPRHVHGLALELHPGIVGAGLETGAPERPAGWRPLEIEVGCVRRDQHDLALRLDD